MDETPPLFSIRTYSQAGWTIGSLSGELDIATAPELSNALTAYQGSKAPIALDLSELTFIDSSGLRALLSTNSGGRPLTLVCPGGHIGRILELAGVDRILAVVESIDDLPSAQTQKISS